ncbi:hypothetical protein DQG23_17655 [Paenibacillus contaminans]|uniref:Uncharacterized protein n=2 Tax=Paenibacillus contaminans TaxID=450362 RepID=A0A329MII7_9BACL|nr:hypothetical protein DQG23_17655 [Paenibacillus contaminans]
MAFMNKIGLMMNMPDGKQPGFYAQIVKELASKVQLFDRDKELLIVNDEAERDAAQSVLAHYKVEAEQMPLVLLPQNAELYDPFSDYGFESLGEHLYLYEKIVKLFRFDPHFGEDAEPAQALLQFDEHLIARYTDDDGVEYFAVDAQQLDLMEGIAKAYKCSIKPA